ncbi:glycosyltransferase [[Clostridium] fimetarium]|uniref:Rhamnosyl/mannosyltransferase n=1 Tax=[Clostridium] fimetarium TaxID=99656 RepID=A0A1I0RM02_9FIRM|nr:glycosyltransferase [[Clostridium] fimetarium]SEW41960.1 rhamnosyl/mannosyltransferase [[Clostridium] fimetarium]
MKKVLQISKYYYPFIGGTEQVVRDIVSSLKKNDDIQQKVLCFNEDATTDGVTTKKGETITEYVDDVEIIRCGYIAKISSQSISCSLPSVLKKILNEFEPDIIIFHYPNPFVANYLLKDKRHNFKLVIYWHLDITRQKLLGKMFHSQNIRLIKRADKIIGATPKHINESAYTSYFGGKKEVLPYAIDEERLKISDEEKQKALEIRRKYNDEMICFFIGRHVPYKGLEYLIEASKHINGNVKTIIAGTGVLTKELKIRAANNTKIEFVGKITDSEWRAYLWACDVFCFPSITRNEGFGLALAEGMYYGKPAVTFKIVGSGVNYVNLDGVTGIECTNSNSKAYADAICKLYEDVDLRERYGKNARNRVLENFTYNSFEKNILKLVETL